MSAISYLLGNATQVITSLLPESVAIPSGAAAIASGVGQVAGPVSGSVAVLGAIGGGVALWRQIKAPEDLPPGSLDKEAVLERLRDGRLKLSQVPQLCNDFDAVLSATQFDPFAVRHAGAELRQTPQFREIAVCAVEGYAACIENRATFRDWVVNSIHVFRNGNVMESLTEFHGDFDILRIAAQADPRTIRYANEDLYQNPLFRELVLGMVRRDPYLLEDAGPFRNDYEIVGSAVAFMPATLCYAGAELMSRSVEFDHLGTIAHLRTTLMNGDEVVRDSISHQEALSMLHKNPNSTFEQEISRWTTEYKKTFPENPTEDPQLALEEEPKRLLKTFLQRVREVRDYQKGGQGKANVIALVHRFLHLAAENKEFQGCLIANLTQAETDCDDNVLIRLIDIEVMAQMYDPKLTDDQFRAAAIGAERYELIKKHVLSRHAGVEEIETLLYVLIELKEPLDLPISTIAMGHPTIAKVTDRMLEEIRQPVASVSDQELLAKSSYWEQRMAQRQKERLSQIDDAHGELMNDLDDYFGLPSADEQESFLQKNPKLAAWLKNALRAGVTNEYCALSNFLARDKERAIADIQ